MQFREKKPETEPNIIHCTNDGVAILGNGRRGIVVMDFDCYTGNHGSIPTHGDSFNN